MENDPQISRNIIAIRYQSAHEAFSLTSMYSIRALLEPVFALVEGEANLLHGTFKN